MIDTIQIIIEILFIQYFHTFLYHKNHTKKLNLVYDRYTDETEYINRLRWLLSNNVITDEEMTEEIENFRIFKLIN